MWKIEKIKDSEKTDKNSRISQFTDNLSSRIKEVFYKSPEIIEAFWHREWRLDKCESSDRVQEITEGENKYLKITVKPWDKKEWKRKVLERWTERAEIQQKEKINYDEVHIQNFTFQIPEDFALCPRRTVIRQRKRSPQITGDDAPLLSHRIKKIDGKYYLVLTDWNRDEIWKRIPMEGNEGIIWKDVRIESKIKFSDNWESMVSVVMNCEWKETIIYEEWPINIFHPKEIKSWTKAYFKFGIYRDCYKHAIRKIKKEKKMIEEDEKLTEEEKKVQIEEKKLQIEEIKKAKEKERSEDSYIFLKDYNIKKSGE